MTRTTSTDVVTKVLVGYLVLDAKLFVVRLTNRLD